MTTIELPGLSRTYRAKFGVLCWCRIEERTGLSRNQVLRALRRPRPKVTLLLEFLRAGLVEPPDPTLEEAAEILEDIGGLAMLQPAIPAPPPTKRRRTH